VIGLYRALAPLVTPAVALALLVRRALGREDPSRLAERWGHAARPRPAGRLIWLHAASVGEAQSVLPLIERLTGAGLAVLVTSGTVTSARLLGERLPAGATHHYVPVDLPSAVGRFLDHWRPDAAIWVESELWPNLVLSAAERGIPLALVQGRMSARSLRRWQGLPQTARKLVSLFRPCLCQTEADAGRYRALGAPEARCLGNLKMAAPPLPVDPVALAALSTAIGGRPVWCAASTHDPEERIVAEAHRDLLRRHPELLLILAPRHPARGGEVAVALSAEGLRVARRGLGALPTADTDVYLADTMGELGLVYRIAPIAFVGGSLIPHGGQNPLEPARLGCALLHGPSMTNFSEATALLAASGGSETVADGESLARAVDRLLADPALLTRRRAAIGTAVPEGSAVLDAIWAEIEPFARGAGA